MEISILIAQIISIMYLSFAVGFLINKKYYQKIIIEIIADSSFMIFGGIFALLVGFLMVHFHNIWTNDWTVTITIFGWIALIKGIMLIAFPKFTDFFKPLFKNNKLFNFLFPILLIIGLFFGYLGFFS